MKSLEDLSRTEGVVMACEFDQEGECDNYRSSTDMSQEMANKAGQYIATVTMLFKTLGEAFSKESGMKWAPQQGWTYSGGDWTVIVRGNKAVFVETSKANLGELTKSMGSESEQRVKPSV